MCVLRSGGCGVAPVPPGTIFKKRVIVYPEVGNRRQSHLLVCRGIYIFFICCVDLSNGKVKLSLILMY